MENAKQQLNAPNAQGTKFSYTLTTLAALSLVLITTSCATADWLLIKPGFAMMKAKGQVLTMGLGPNVPVPDGKFPLISAEILWVWPVALFSMLPAAAGLRWALRRRRRTSRGFPVVSPETPAASTTTATGTLRIA